MARETLKQFLNEYQKIKTDVVAFIEAERKNNNDDYDDKLELLKHRLGKDIRSVRQLDAAKDVQKLLHLLEKRLALGWFNVDPLTEVTETFEMGQTNTFSELMKYRYKLNDFKVSNKESFTSPPYDPDIFSEFPNNRVVLPPKVIEEICRLLGKDWRNFGREMVNEDFLTEGQFDELKRNASLTDKAATNELLHIFVNGGDKRSKLSQLSKLLRMIHRNDIEESVESIVLSGSHSSS